MRDVEETKFHQRPEACGIALWKLHRFQLASVAVICLKKETNADVERDFRDLISRRGCGREVASRETTALHGSADKSHPLELEEYSLERAGASSSEMDLKQ